MLFTYPNEKAIFSRLNESGVGKKLTVIAKFMALKTQFYATFVFFYFAIINIIIFIDIL